MTATAATRDTASGIAFGRVAVAATAAVAADLLLLWAGTAAGASLKIDAPYDLNAAVVVLGTAVPMLAGAAVTWLLTRRHPGRVSWFGWAGLVVALLSAPMPFVVSADTATAVTLALMHVVVGVAWLVALRRRNQN